MIRVLGVPELLARFVSKGVASEIALKTGIDTLGRDVETEAKRIVPVLSGDLQDSITYDGEGRVYTDMIYASQVEYGGPHNPPEPYMRPAADTVQDSPALAAMKAVIDHA